MLHDRIPLDQVVAAPTSAIRAIADTNARAVRHVFERASLAYLLVLIGLFSVAFLHDPETAKTGLIASSPFVVGIILVAALILRGLPTRAGVWAMLMMTNAATTIVTIMMGGLAYHSLPLLFFTFSLAAGFLTLRDVHYAMLTSLAALFIISGITHSSNPWDQIQTTGPIDNGESYLIAYLALLGAFAIAAWINSDARIAQERRIVAALKRAEHAGVEKTKFFSLVSHEMRTPLNGLIGLSELLIATGASCAVQARAKTISLQARQLGQAIEHVLEVIEKDSVQFEAPPDQKTASGRERRNSEVLAIAFALFFSALTALCFLYDPARAHTAILVSLPFAAMIWATPILVRRGMKGQTSIRISSWATLGAVTVICIEMGGLAFPAAHLILVLPGIASTRGGMRDVLGICLGCLAAILIIHSMTADAALDVAHPNLTPENLSWLISAVVSLASFAYGNWASARARFKRLDLLQAALKRAESVDQTKNHFLTQVGQQLSSSINTIQSECKAFEEEATDAERQIVMTLRQSADMFVGILNSIQKYADPLGPVAPQELFNPETLADKVLDEFAQTAADKNVKMDAISLFRERATCLGSLSEIEMILRVLADNAAKFTDVGAIRIAVGPGGPNRIAFAVEDTGPGVPSEKIARIFESFMQGDQSEVRIHGGLGLGLAIARKRARQLGGDVTYVTRVGGGSIFTLTVPLAFVPD